MSGWRIEPEVARDGRRGYWIEDDSDFVALVCIRGNESEELKHAHLVAAAPALLSALEGVLSVADRSTVEFDAARTAIASATGATP